ncbi:MAG: LysM peptidoglycan-binding domain-containing protein [Treponema sp.]|jgi:hypothetical protein|nr:LysM peptidoglycan-binding domain-containing protein [Treponema sp.]
MKARLFGILGILVTGFVFSCKSTGTSAPSPAPVPAPAPVPTPAPVPNPGAISTSSPNPEPEEEKILEQIYDQHEEGIILTGAKEYTVIRGDTLSKIARKHYGTGGNAYYFPLIIAASKSITSIVDPDEIEVGMHLIIPDLQKNLDDPGARGSLKNLLKEIAGFYSHKPGRQSAGLYTGLIRLYNTL